MLGCPMAALASGGQRVKCAQRVKCGKSRTSPAKLLLRAVRRARRKPRQRVYEGPLAPQRARAGLLRGGALCFLTLTLALFASIICSAQNATNCAPSTRFTSRHVNFTMTSRTVVRLTGLEDIYKAVVVSGFTQSQASPTEALSVSKVLSARGLEQWEAAMHHCPRHLHATIAAAATLAMRGVETCVKLKFHGAFVLIHRVDLHAIDAKSVSHHSIHTGRPRGGKSLLSS